MQKNNYKTTCNKKNMHEEDAMIQIRYNKMERCNSTERMSGLQMPTIADKGVWVWKISNKGILWVQQMWIAIFKERTIDLAPYNM